MGYHLLLLGWFRERRDDDEAPSLPGQLLAPEVADIYYIHYPPYVRLLFSRRDPHE